MVADLNALAGLLATLRFRDLNAVAYIIPATLLLYYALRWRMNTRKIIYFAVRVAVAFLLFVALAEPYLRGATDVTVDATSVDVLADASASMRLYPGYEGMPERVYARLKTEFENQSLGDNVKLRFFSRGNSTAVGDAILSSVVDSSKENTMVVLLSDGMSNMGREPASVASLAADSNATVFVVIAGEPSADVSVTEILGGRKTPVRAPYEVGIVIEKTGDEPAQYQLEVSVDGKTVESKKNTQAKRREVVGFSFRFDSVGQHTIEVMLTPFSGDLFAENNRMTKTVECIDKARVLVIGRETDTPLAQTLSEVYEVEQTGTFRQSYTDYAAVYVNDVEARPLDNNFEALRSFVLDGGGLVVAGGNNSFEWGDYNNSLIEALLPVKSSTEPERKRKPITVLFLLDISSSTGYGKTADTKLDIEKAIAAKIIRDLKDEDEVGLIAFNLLAYKVNEITRLAEGRDYLVENILRLRPIGGSKFIQALKTADTMLEGVSNDKYVIIITDGLVPLSSLSLSREYAELLAEKGAKVYTIGVGFDTSEELLSKLAESGNGQYFKPEHYERINIEFGGKGEPEGDENRVVVHSQYHFIARNLDLAYTPVESYNVVREKLNAQLVLTTEAGDPILTVWRFGLGRVAALSTDDGGYWAPQLYEGDSGKLFTSLINWVAGDLEKTKKVNVETQDLHLGETQYITVRAEGEPTVTLKSPGGDAENLPVRRRGVERFEASYTPKAEGVYYVYAGDNLGSDQSSFSVNYQKEYKRMGTDLGLLKDVSESTGGGVYDTATLSELAAKINEISMLSSKRRVFEEKPIYQYLIIIALLIYFLDACARRVGEIYRLRKNR